MLAGRRENVTLIRVSGGTTDDLTEERIAGGTTTETTVSVCWASAPVTQSTYDKDSGKFLGVVQVADASFLYDTTGDDALDWSNLLGSSSTVRRSGVDYVPVSVGDWTHKSWQVVRLKRKEVG